jgi:hypothetical protein
MEQQQVIIELSATEAEYLSKPINGHGGYQSMLRRLQPMVQSGQLVMPREEAERLCAYANRYGQGGFQGRLKSIAAKVEQAISTQASDA